MDSKNLEPLNTRSILNYYGIKPSKGLGQNFIVNDGILAEIAKSARIEPNDIVLEIGPGFGSLTRHLALASKKVVAVELDRKLIPALQDILQSFQNIRIVQGDILEINPGDLIQDENYLVVANIPYYITSNLIRHLLESELKPRKIVITVQKEIAERICFAEKGNLLANSIRAFGEPSILMNIPASVFYPKPNVDSSVIQIDLYKEPFLNNVEMNDFFLIMKAGFSQKRKTLRNSLASGLHKGAEEIISLLGSAGIDPMRRAETLDLEEWKEILQEYRKRNSAIT